MTELNPFEKIAEQVLTNINVEFDISSRKVLTPEGQRVNVTIFSFSCKEAPFGDSTIDMLVRLDVSEHGFMIIRTIPKLPDDFDVEAFFQEMVDREIALNIGHFDFTPDTGRLAFTHGILIPEIAIEHSIEASVSIVAVNLVMAIEAWKLVKFVPGYHYTEFGHPDSVH